MFSLEKCCQEYVSRLNYPGMEEDNRSPTKHFLLQEAIEFLRTKKPQEAAPLLAQYLRINPDSEEGWVLISYAVQEPDKKIECIQRVLKINPVNSQARQRLKKLLDSIPPEELEQPEPKKFPFWITLGTIFVIGCIILAGGIWGFRSLFGAPPTIEPPTPTLDTVEKLSSETPYPTYLPDASATATPTHTLTPSPTLPATVTPAALDESTTAQMDEIAAQVSGLRELTELEPVTRAVIEQGYVRPILESVYLERHTRAEVTDQARVLSALGLIDPTYDLYTKTLNQIGEGIGGFYIPWTDELYVIGETFSGIERFVYAHEYTHALVDQHFDLSAFGVYPECLSDSDRCLAISALVEGDATYLMYQWLGEYGTEEDINDILAAQYAPIDRRISASDLPPPYVIRETQFRYGESTLFIDHLYQIGEWQMIDIAYTRLPETTEQILHPQKYQVREGAKPVEIPVLDEILGERWRLLASDSLGELGTEMILGYAFDGLDRLDPETAKKAAAGWGGDHFQIFYKGITNGKVLAAAWTWDTLTDALQFWDALEAHLHLRYDKNRVDHPDGFCWEKLNEEFACIFKIRSDTLWIIAPDRDAMELVRSQFESFK